VWILIETDCGANHSFYLSVDALCPDKKMINASIHSFIHSLNLPTPPRQQLVTDADASARW
jgi:hypothetical protein